jgi:hypothetical protein
VADVAGNPVLRAYVDDLCARCTVKYNGYGDNPVRDPAWAELRALTDLRLMPAFQAKLAQRPRAEVSEVCYRGLCALVEQHKHRAGADYLLGALANTWQTCRLAILRWLVNFVLLCDSELAFQCVHPFLESENQEVRLAATAVLGRLGHPLCLTALLQYLQASTKEEDVHAALKALEACGDATLLPYTLDYAVSSHGKAYWPAITCIASWLRGDATPFLISVLERQRHNKEIAVKELAKWGDERALPQVTKRVKAQVKKLVQGSQHIPWDLTDGVKYLKRFREQSCFDELNAQLVTFIQGLPENVVYSFGRQARADLLGLLEPEGG